MAFKRIRHCRKGLTLIELLFALFVVFIAVCSLAGVMVSTYSYFHSLQDRSTTLQLCNQTIRQSLWDGAGGDFSGYPELAKFGTSSDWWGSFPSYDPTFGSVVGMTVTATTPTGAAMTMERGWHTFGQGGVAVKDNGEVAYGIYYNDARTIGIFADAGSTLIATYPKMPVRAWSEPGHHPIPPQPGGMCWDSTNNVLYVSDVGDGGTFPINNPEGTNAWLGNPKGPGSVSIAMQPLQPIVWGTAGHMMWNDAAGNMGTDTDPGTLPCMPLPPAATNGPALGQGQELCFDPSNPNSLWVTDEKFMCIRHCPDCTSPHAWEPYQYKIAAGSRMGCPVLMVMASSGGGPSTLIVYDGTNIWQFASPANGVLTPVFAPCVLPAAEVGKIHGIGYNKTYDGGNDVFFTDYLDRLYKYTVSTNTFNATPIH